MAVIANLDVNLKARTQQFDQPIEKSTGIFGRFQSTVGKFSAAKLAGFGAALAGVAGGFFAVSRGMAAVNEQFDALDDIAKLSDDLGASVTTLQALRLQANLTGTSLTTLEKGMQRFSRVLGDARQGNATAVDGFEQIGLAVEDFEGKSFAEQIGLVSDAIMEGETAADRASNAYAVFGRQGQEMMTFFAGGSAGIAQAAQDIEDFGGNLSRMDVAQVELMNDAFTRLGTLTDVIFQNIAVQAAPVMQALVEMFIDAGKESQGFGETIGNAFQLIVDGIKFSLNAWEVFTGAIKMGQSIIQFAVEGFFRGLAAIEQGLMRLGGDRFDFGIGELSAQMQGEAAKTAAEAAKMIERGFSGEAGNEFQARLDKIVKTAHDIAQDPPEIPETPIPETQWSDFFLGFGDALQNEWDNKSEEFKMGLPAFEKAVSDAVAPSVAALTRGSSAAASAVNRANREAKQDNKVEAAVDRNVDATEQVADAIATQTEAIRENVGVFISVPA